MLGFAHIIHLMETQELACVTQTGASSVQKDIKDR